jgi:hypothetical protein
MNATVQALRAIPELQAALKTSVLPSTDISSALRDLFVSMDRTKMTKGSVTPTEFWQRLRVAIPQFGVMDESGTHYMQQGRPVFSLTSPFLLSSRVTIAAASLCFVLPYRCGRVLDTDY